MQVNQDIYCFTAFSWPCLTQSEWASWVQAVGSLMAIAVAIAVPAYMHQVARKEMGRREAAELKAIRFALLDQVGEFEAFMGVVLEDLDKTPPEVTHIDVQRLELQPLTLLALGKVHLMPDHGRAVYGTFFYGRSVAHLVDLSGMLKSGGQALSAPSMKKLRSDCVAGLDSAKVALRLLDDQPETLSKPSDRT